MSYNRALSTPPPEPIETKVKYTKKARHGHGKDVIDSHNIRQVAGCLPIDPAGKRILLISSSKNPEHWVIVSTFYSSVFVNSLNSHSFFSIA